MILSSCPHCVGGADLVIGACVVCQRPIVACATGGIREQHVEGCPVAALQIVCAYVEAVRIKLGWKP